MYWPPLEDIPLSEIYPLEAPTLTWADEFIESLLAEEEKYQDVLRDLPTTAIFDTTSKLDHASEEYLTGLEILQNRATNYTSHALVVIDEEVNEDAWKVSTETDKANKEADAEADEIYFNIDREIARIRLEIEADLDKAEGWIEEWNKSTFQRVEEWLTDFEEDLHSLLWGWIPSLANDAAVYLASLPAMLLFESFKDFLFEDVE